MYISEIHKNIEKFFGFLRKLRLNWLRQTLTFAEGEYLSSAADMFSNSLQISDITNKEFFELKLFQIKKKF